MKNRKRLQKQDMEVLADKLRNLGLDVRRIDGFSLLITDGSTYIGRFNWCPAQPPEWGSPYIGHWELSITHDIHCLADVEAGLRELNRVRLWRRKLREAWTSFSRSRSEKRWQEYRSYVAAIYLKMFP